MFKKVYLYGHDVLKMKLPILTFVYILNQITNVHLIAYTYTNCFTPLKN